MAVILPARPGGKHDGPRRRSAGGRRGWAQPGLLRPRLLPHLEGLDHVAGLRRSETAQGQTTLEALADLGGVVLEPLQRADRDVVRHHGALAQDARLAVAADETGPDHTADDETDLGRAEHLADLRRAL